MARRLRISAPPPASGSHALWFQQVHDAINNIPNFSIFSTSDGPESNETGNSGDIGIDIGSSNTTFWFKRHGDDNTSGWSAVGFA